jgi:Cdc6-like AAA superfamily ATPase
MSIRNNIGYYTSVTTQPRALQHFTDRYPLIRRFAHYLHDSAPPSTILFLYGDGGNGKSLLLRYSCCDAR